MMPRIRLIFRFVKELLLLLLRERGRVDAERYITLAYRVFLKRNPEPEGLRHYLAAFERGESNGYKLARELVHSNECKEVAGLPASPSDSLHRARMELVQRHLPPAERIVDLGGASIGDSAGALLAMGYPHHPRDILIVDLPPDARLFGGEGAEANPTHTTPDGTVVRYHYSTMGDLASVASGTVDLVWSGESIEHVSEEEGDRVCQEAYRVLKPGGYFCLDTPNAALTRLESPDAFIHPEHQKEYTVPELRAKLERWGFRVVESKGICPMPESVRTQRYQRAEMLANLRLSDDAEQSYLFFLKAIKPS